MGGKDVPLNAQGVRECGVGKNKEASKTKNAPARCGLCRHQACRFARE